MRKVQLLGLFLVALPLAVYGAGCSSDDSSGNAAGTGGSAGSTAGKGGSGGAGGSTAGTGGTGGSTAGTGGAGGSTAGTGGAGGSTAGTGGSTSEGGTDAEAGSEASTEAGSDASTDAVSDATGDAGPTCTDYCTCMADTCASTTFTKFDAGDCVTACAGFTPTQLTCRTQHCGLAQMAGDASAAVALHCGHAVAEGASTPPACQ